MKQKVWVAGGIVVILIAAGLLMVLAANRRALINEPVFTPLTPKSSPTLSPQPTVMSTETLKPIVVNTTQAVIRTPSASPSVTVTRTPLPTNRATATITSVEAAYFAIGPGFSDVIPHQVVRANNDRLYIVAGQPYVAAIHVYAMSAEGFPDGPDSFYDAASVTTSANPISVEAVYDGASIIHVLTNLNDGQLLDYAFNIDSKAFEAPTVLATDGATVVGDYIGSSGVSAMLDLSGQLQVVYWAAGGEIVHRVYTADGSTGALVLVSGPDRVDVSGSANHPVVAVSPIDNSLTVAWVSEAANPPQILARERLNTGAWNNPEIVNAAPVWYSTNAGINIDQGPSLLIGPDGVRHLTYIENYDATHDYGHIHYAADSGAGWTDTAINAYSHDPALAVNNSGQIYIIGHGHPLNSSCRSLDAICTIKQNGATWDPPQLFAAPPAGQSFDSSPSVKWSVVGFNRPEVIEFLFFAAPYNTPTLYYARLP